MKPIVHGGYDEAKVTQKEKDEIFERKSRKVKKGEEKELLKEELDKVDDQSYQDAEAKREFDERANVKEEAAGYVHSKLITNSYETYFQALCDYGNYLVGKIDFPRGFKAKCVITSGTQPTRLFGEETVTPPRGVLMVFWDGKRNFIRGIKPTWNPDYDIHAIEILSDQVENTLDNITGSLEPPILKN